MTPTPALLSLLLALPGPTSQERGIERVPEGPEASSLSLSVRVEASIDGQNRPLATGSAVRSGTRLQAFVTVDQPAYVYMVQYFADGTAAVLHPESGHVQLSPGSEVRLPEAGVWFELDDEVGEEHLYFIASARPLGEADRTLARAIEQIRNPPPPSPPAKRPASGSDAAPAKSAASAPARLNFRTRGIVRVSGEGPASVSVSSGPDGIAAYELRLRHLPRAP